MSTHRLTLSPHFSQMLQRIGRRILDGTGRHRGRRKQYHIIPSWHQVNQELNPQVYPTLHPTRSQDSLRQMHHQLLSHEMTIMKVLRSLFFLTSQSTLNSCVSSSFLSFLPVITLPMVLLNHLNISSHYSEPRTS